MDRELSGTARKDSGNAGEEKERLVHVSGWYACLALFQNRPQDIRRIYVERRRAKMIGKILSWAAKQRLPYTAVSFEELTRLAGTPHHEGIVFTSREKPILPAAEFPRVELAVALDSVANPHNLGAILRTCAFFGVEALLLGGKQTVKRLSPAVLRTSEGGAEVVRVFRSESLADSLAQLKSMGYKIVGTDVHGKDIFKHPKVLPEKGPLCLVLGSESAGMTPEVRASCNSLVRIPGSETVESLNVSVACGIFLAFIRQRMALSPKAKGSQPRPQYPG